MTLTALLLAIISKIYSLRLKSAFTLAEVLIAIVSDLKQTFYFRDDSVSRRPERVRENKMFAFAFTLAEVLIVLGIIGLIADMTIPTLVSKTDEKVTVTKLKKVYSTFYSAYTMAVQENGTPDNWSTEEGTNPIGAQKYLEILAPYLNLTKKCGSGLNSSGCFKANEMYKKLNGSNYNVIDNMANMAKARLADGSSFSIWHSNGLSCRQNLGTCGELIIDINGDKKPNTYGKDTFIFLIQKNKFVPNGTAAMNDYFEKHCLNTTSSDSGWGCAAWVIYNENMDYLHCSDLSWDGKKSCK